jgi:hypothetical protein
MKTAIVSLSIIIFIVFGGSLFYSQHSYNQYRNLWPRRDPVGLLTGIRASLGFSRDLNNKNLSDECRKYFKRFKIGATISIFTIFVGILFILLVRAFGLQDVLDQ